MTITITTGLNVFFRGRQILARVEFTKIEGGWRAQVISGNNLGKLPIQARTLTEQEFEAVFSDVYDSIANARRALRLFGLDT